MNPTADEICDGIDNDCSIATSEDGLVTTDGSHTFSSITQALLPASSGSTVLVCDGTYTGGSSIDDDITLVSLNGASATTLQGNGSVPVLGVTSGEVTISGFTIRGGGGAPNPAGLGGSVGGGVMVTSPDDVTVEDCWITDNEAALGAGVYAGEGSDLTVIDSTISYNDAEEHGGGLCLESGSFALQSVDVQYNSADTGGGIYVDDAVLSLDAVLVEDNYAVQGGGLASTATLVTASADSVVGSNSATDAGGGLLLYDDSIWQGGEVSDNAADYGAGIFVLMEDGGSAVLESSLVMDNEADTSGGGVYAYGDVLFTDVQLSGQRASWGAGLFLDSSSASMTGCTLEENEAQLDGGGAYLHEGSSLTVTDGEWGSGSTDNDPDDVYVEGGSSYASYGSGESFACSYASGACY